MAFYKLYFSDSPEVVNISKANILLKMLLLLVKCM